MRVSKGFGLRLQLANGSQVRLDGFADEQFDEVHMWFSRQFDVELGKREVSKRGWNWGLTEFEGGGSLVFKHSPAPGSSQPVHVFDVPMSEVANTALASKTEVSVEFKLAPDLGTGDELVEMRFFVPSKSTGAGGDVDDDGMEIDGGSADAGEDAASAFYETIKTLADIGIVVGDAIVPFHELPFLVPRGRYEVDMFDDFMRMHGKSYDYKILFKSVKALYLLPKPDQVHDMFIISLDPPIRQGQTRYPYLVMQFLRDEELEITLSSVTDADLQSKFDGKLQKQYDAPTSEVVSSVFSAMTGLKVIKATASSYKSAQSTLAVKCSYKANEGYIYPLEKSIMFVPKPAADMAYSSIAQVTFSRVGQSTSASRTFDLKITLKRGGDMQFSGIPREEHTKLDEFLRLKGVRVKNEISEDEAAAKYADMSSSSDDDEGAQRKVAAIVNNEGGDDDSEEDDEDFVAKDESDVEEEFNEDYDSSGGSSSSGEDDKAGDESAGGEESQDDE